MQPALPAIKLCGPLSGDVLLQFDVADGAATGEVNLDGQIDAPETTSCIFDQLEKVRFEAKLNTAARWLLTPDGD